MTISGEGINNIALLECFLASSSRSSENNSLKVKKIEWQETGA
jgi:hypothetical protein